MKIPKQEYTPEFNGLSVKRVKPGQSIGVVAKGLGLIEQTLRNWVKADDALTMAWFHRKPTAGLIHHSDRGSQYASHAYQARLKEYGAACSMCRKGNYWDNAPTESCFGSFKNERVYGERLETRDEVIAMTFEYIDVFYNRKPQHSTLGYKSPMKFMSDWLNAPSQGKLIA